MILFSIEAIDVSPEETYRLWELHWQETEAAYRNDALNPDWEQYRMMDRAGMSVYYTAREDGKLIGHVYFIIHKERHAQKLSAVEDFLYLDEEARGKGVATQLLHFAITDLKARGCSPIGMSSKLTGKKDIGPLLAKVGFRHVANYYVLE